MSPELILFLVLSLVAIAAAIGMLISPNPVYSALFLVINFSTVAVFYLILGAPFIAMAQITIYAGAIMVLFLFVIMLLGAEKLAPGKVLPYQKPLAIGLAIVLMVESVYAVLARNPSDAEIIVPTEAANSIDAMRDLGIMLFSDYLLPFEVTSILLLVAMIGAIVLTKRAKGEQE
ncbi:MAG: NADH-quinone oxidoreductase subunit J [Anaerolineae bacterium]|nr:NADH-quinone oxidoreductase subunit J [Anaerolineae bacterium]